MLVSRFAPRLEDFPNPLDALALCEARLHEREELPGALGVGLVKVVLLIFSKTIGPLLKFFVPRFFFFVFLSFSGDFVILGLTKGSYFFFKSLSQRPVSFFFLFFWASGRQILVKVGGEKVSGRRSALSNYRCFRL